MQIDFTRLKDPRVIVSASLVAFLLLVLWFIPPVWKLKSTSVEVTRYLKKGTVNVLVGPKEKDWTPIRTVSRHVLNAIVVAEDGRFYQHHGLDFEEISNAIALNLKKGRYVRGGSTISQQVVKTAFLSREKSLVRKAREAVGTVLMEKLLTKDEILEWYINLVEFGDGVYGISAAARHYFGTKAELLTIEQGANLALVLPSPNAWSVGLRRKKLTPFGHRRYAHIINNMRMGGYITETLWLHALATGDFGQPVQAYEQALARVGGGTEGSGELSSALAKDLGSLDEDVFDPGAEEQNEERRQSVAQPSAFSAPITKGEVLPETASDTSDESMSGSEDDDNTIIINENEE